MISFEIAAPVHARPHAGVSRCRGRVLARALVRPVLTVTSRQNEWVKHCVRLRDHGKYRREHGSLLLVGRSLVLDVFQHVQICSLIFMSNEAVPSEWWSLDSPLGEPRSMRVSPQVMQIITGLQTVPPNMLVAVVGMPPLAAGCPDAQAPRQLVLDGVQDPGNEGALLRSAFALGWDSVTLLPGCCDPFNDKCLRASRGASLRLQLCMADPADLLASWQAQDRTVLVAGPRPANVPCPRVADMARRDRLALVLGAEGRGVHPGLAGACHSIAVPMRAGSVESLNVAVAGGILMAALAPDDVNMWA